MARLEDRLTPITPSEIAVALATAWRGAFGGEPARASLLVLLAQWALETGRGKAMHCYNLGNIKSNGITGDWCFFRCNEIIQGRLVWFEPDHPSCRFRAFGSLDEGAIDYLQTVHARFHRSWTGVLTGDPVAYAHLLKVQHYYTADEGLYAGTLRALFYEFERTLPDATKSPPLPDLYTERGVQLVLEALGFHPGEIDGLDGPNTRSAVAHFQRSYGLVADGIVGRLTRQALADAWCAKAAAV
jgi:hypothetical protein